MTKSSIQSLWQGQPAAFEPMSLEQIRAQAARFSGSIRNRNRREYVAAIIVIIIFWLYAWFFSLLCGEGWKGFNRLGHAVRYGAGEAPDHPSRHRINGGKHRLPLPTPAGHRTRCSQVSRMVVFIATYARFSGILDR